MKLFGGNNRGQMALGGGLGNVINIVFALFFIGILIFAFSLAGGEMGNTAGENQCDNYWNETSGQCEESSTNSTEVSFDDEAYNTITKTVSGAEDFANFSPTLWIMAAIAALITILLAGVGVFFFGRR